MDVFDGRKKFFVGKKRERKTKREMRRENNEV
jgi:hypothetical protein